MNVDFTSEFMIKWALGGTCDFHTPAINILNVNSTF